MLTAISSIDKLNELINALLDYARGVAENITLSISSFKLTPSSRRVVHSPTRIPPPGRSSSIGSQTAGDIASEAGARFWGVADVDGLRQKLFIYKLKNQVRIANPSLRNLSFFIKISLPVEAAPITRAVGMQPEHGFSIEFD